MVDSPAHDDNADIAALTSIPWKGRAVLLVDLDAFFASVEQLDHPGWRGKPVIVGGSADKRGVVSTASYEARKFGVHSAMPSSTARRLCPEAIWTTGNFSRYREVSQKVMDILFDETPIVQQVSIDEAFLDVTPTKVNSEHPVSVAKRIQDRVEQLGVSCSIGIGTTKSIAKMASDMDKPRGLTVIPPGSERNFLDPLPVRRLSGVGASTERVLSDMGIMTLGDLARSSDDQVIGRLGKVGRMILDRSRCEEDDAVVIDDETKSVSNETSFARDLTARADIEAAIDTMAAKVARRLRRKALAGNTLALKVRYSDLKVRSNQIKLSKQSDDESEFIPLLHQMLDSLWQEGMALRLVGVAVTGFEEEPHNNQLSLFDDEEECLGETGSFRQLSDATDKVKERFGESAVVFGRELRLRGHDTGSSSKNPADYK